MSFSVPPTVVGALGKLPFRPLMGWNHRFHLLGNHPVVKCLGSIPPIGDQPLEGEPFDKWDGFLQVCGLSCRHRQAQRVAQAIDRDMDFGAETAATTSQGLRCLSACFFGRRPRRDERAQWWSRSSHFPCLDHRHSVPASVPKYPVHTSEQTAYTPCSISRIRLVKVAIGHHSGLSRAPLQHSGGSRLHCRRMHVDHF
jgi:hypothetical protein